MKRWISRDTTDGPGAGDWLARNRLGRDWERRGWLQLTRLVALDEAGGKLFWIFRGDFVLFFEGRVSARFVESVVVNETFLSDG